MTYLSVVQGSDEWVALRRTLVTATDIPVLLGLSPYKCEADVADEKLYGTTQPSTLRMRAGTAMQDFVGAEYSLSTGRPIKRVRGVFVHDELAWAGASPDFRVVGERRLVEAKTTGSRSRFADGLPQDVEAQVVWQLGVSGFPVADVAALVSNDDLVPFEVRADPVLFADLVAIAQDFRARLAAGGPFARDANRIKRDYPTDNGAEMVADAELSEAVLALAAMRTQRKDTEAAEERIETAIKSRMGEATSLVGQGFRITWKQTKPSEQIDWKSVADGALRQLPETEARALVGIATTVRSGFRPFRVTLDKE